MAAERPLLAAADALLAAVVEGMGDPAPAVRQHAVRALATVVDSDPAVLMQV
jgi:hypothetical protein